MKDTLVIRTEGNFHIEVELTNSQSEYIKGKLAEHLKDTNNAKYFPLQVYIKDENTVEDKIPETKTDPSPEVYMTEPENSTYAPANVKAGDKVPETKADPSPEVYEKGPSGKNKVPETKSDPQAEVKMENPEDTKHATAKAKK